MNFSFESDMEWVHLLQHAVAGHLPDPGPVLLLLSAWFVAHLQGDTVEEQQLAWSVFLLEADMYAMLDDVWNGEHNIRKTCLLALSPHEL